MLIGQSRLGGFVILFINKIIPKHICLPSRFSFFFSLCTRQHRSKKSLTILNTNTTLLELYEIIFRMNNFIWHRLHVTNAISNKNNLCTPA